MVYNPDPTEAEYGPVEGESAVSSPAISDETEISPVAWVQIAPQQANLVDLFSDVQLAELAQLVEDEYDLDHESMKDWREAMEAGLKMAGGEREDKEWPWKGASNVKYPLILTAALQFNARAYPAIVPSGDIVKATTHGGDPGGQKRARAERVAAFQSYQCRHVMREWEGDTDRLLMTLAIVGTLFRKTWFDPSKGRMVSRVPKPGAVVVNDAAQDLDGAPRVSEEMTLYPHEVMERQRAGIYKTGDWWKPSDDDDTSAPIEFIEQHRLYDFDGDGYPEPYVVMWHKESREVVRIVANWQPQDVAYGADENGPIVARIQRRCYYEAFHFIPSHKGGFWGIGLGLLLKDISQAIDDTINRINDAATLGSLSGGFIGKEARLAGGPMRVRPGEWQQVQAAGQDMRAAFFSPPMPGPSPVLFQMLGLLIDAGREIANVKDIAGEAQRTNQPATTTLALIDQGMAVYSAIYKRVHLALKGEFRRMAEINAETLDPQQYTKFHDVRDEQGQPMMLDPRADFDLSDMDIEPVADPRAMTSPQKLAQAQLLQEMAGMGMVSMEAARDRMLDAAGVPDTDDLTPQPDPAMQEKMAAVEQMERDMAETAVRKAMLENVKLGLEIADVEAGIVKKEAEAVKTMAEAEAADPMNPVNVARVQIEALKARIKQNAGNGRGAEGMAQPAGNGGNLAGASQNGGSAQAIDLGAVLGGGVGSNGGMG